MKIKHIQLIIGILFFILGFWMITQSMNYDIKNNWVGGILLGEGAILVLWGLREILLGWALKK